MFWGLNNPKIMTGYLQLWTIKHITELFRTVDLNPNISPIHQNYLTILYQRLGRPFVHISSVKIHEMFLGVKNIFECRWLRRCSHSIFFKNKYYWLFNEIWKLLHEVSRTINLSKTFMTYSIVLSLLDSRM